MFEMSFVEGRARTHKGWTVIVSFALQLGLVVTALLIPLIRPDLLPVGLVASFKLTAPPGPPPAPPAAIAAAAAPARRAVRQVVDGRMLMPARIPRQAAFIADDMAALPTAGTGFHVDGGMPGTGAGGGLASVFSAPMHAAPPPPPLAVESKHKPAVRRIEVGGNVIEAMLIRPAVQPVYPPLARQTRTQGTVVLAALIGPDGRIRNLRVMSGHPLLTQAAIDAVRQWRYRPTLLNGEPMEVDTTIEVRFVLQH
jgi:periplasmic protein TonB